MTDIYRIFDSKKLQILFDAAEERRALRHQQTLDKLRLLARARCS
ncbi:hypothetical protein C7382_1059 [Porphyromonas loveana]|uniref:Uncharacterized protein n=1 Tax=Porphyromonas loveana TaxID=1884669 RepID=A0A2U1FIY4_9PORP|nr:hypothetical protein C7382_1059 [Porphyromonas loveana]